MKVQAIKAFKDLQEGVQRSVGDVFEATEERVSEINGVYSFPLVQPVEQTEGDTKPARKRATGRGRKTAKAE